MTSSRESALSRASDLLAGRAARDVPLGARTTYRVGGAASLFLEASTEDDLAEARAAVVETGVPVLVIGRGSNMLIADAGFRGLAVALGDGFAGIDIDGGAVTAGAGCSLPVLARRTAAARLTGLEWAVGVPGSVGGAVRMNAGGHGSDISRTIRRFRFVDLRGGDDGDADASRLELGYRRSTVAAHHVVLSATFALDVGDRAESESTIAEIVRWRREHQPGGQNAGSVFTNPPGDSAGRLVEAAGMKGHRVGSAFVSPKHANFFQADDGGSADDVRRLIREVQRRVEERTGIRLEPELRMIGFDDDDEEGATG